jgi:hypothetical protein
MEIETMSAKVLPALIVGLLLGTTAIASAQTETFQRNLYTPVIERGVPNYYWNDYYGTPYYNVAPYTAYGQPDPYAGTAYDNVAPY